MRQVARILNLSTRRISAGYLLFGAVWILLSDRLVNALVDTQYLISALQTIKGWLFVALSTVVIFGLVRIRERQLDTSRQRMAHANQELQVLHRIFRHNIRNDMNVIQGYVELVRDRIDTTPQREQLELVCTTTQGIIDMSEKLRVIEDTEVRPSDETVDIVSIVERELDRLESKHPEVTIVSNVADGLSIRGDWALSHVFREVFENAIEHHDGEANSVEISIQIEETLTDVVVRIRDNGPGIPAFEVEAVASGNETQLSHTSGIGLWLITWLSRLYGGSAKFESHPEGGTVVTLAFQRVTALEQFADRALLSEN